MAQAARPAGAPADVLADVRMAVETPEHPTADSSQDLESHSISCQCATWLECLTVDAVPLHTVGRG